MLKYQLNQLDMSIKCVFPGAFLIRDGRYDKDAMKKRFPHGQEQKEWPNSIFMNKNSKEEMEEVARDKIQRVVVGALDYYVPGSSIRGLLRSHAEKIVRTVSPKENDPLCCNPFPKGDEAFPSCTTRLTEKATTGIVYHKLCMVCRLFGAGGHGSRIHFSDGEFDSGYKVRIVDGIGIDRFTCGVAQVKQEGSDRTSGANYNNQVLEGGSFMFSITIRNFEIWQLGLLAFVLRDLENGVLRLGFGKTKGFGKIIGNIQSGALSYWRPISNDRLAGIGDMLPGFCHDYDFKRFSNGSTDLSEKESESDPLKLQLLGAADPFDYVKRYILPKPAGNEKITDVKFWQVCAKHWRDVAPDFRPLSKLYNREEENAEQDELTEEIAGRE